jgi:hypothetical protein
MIAVDEHARRSPGMGPGCQVMNWNRATFPGNPGVSVERRSSAVVEAPYGRGTPPSAVRATTGALRLEQIVVDGEDAYWLEGRSSEGGRNAQQAGEGPPVDVLPEFQRAAACTRRGGDTPCAAA